MRTSSARALLVGVGVFPLIALLSSGCSSKPEQAAADESLGVSRSALNGVATLEAKFVSSHGWVTPGSLYSFKVDYSAGAAGATTAKVKVSLPASATFVSATPTAASGTGTVADPLVFNVGPLSADQSGRIIVNARAASLSQDPQVMWKDLSASASFETTVGVTAQPTLTSKTRGPHVTTLSTARYGDRPFPMINVEYQDIKHCTAAGTPYTECTAAHTAAGLDATVNSKTSGNSIWQLYQDMSFGKLYPIGTVPTANKANATFSGIAQHRFSQLQPSGACTGATLQGSDGTPAYLNRISNGWYQLPGTQAYYGADKTGHAAAGSVTGNGLLFGIDDACGPTGKLVYDSASLADDDLDYNDYDTDRDGVVDFMMVIFAGEGGNGHTEPTGVNNVWPHSSDLRYYFTDSNGQTGYVSNDQLRDLQERPLWWTDSSRTAMTTTDMGAALKVFVRVGPYNVNPEYAQDQASVIAHEYGHSLGLPDFYSTGSRTTFGSWELMGEDHAQFMTVFSRQDLGWVIPKPLTDGNVTIKESKVDTHEIAWTQPDGGAYTLTGPDVHNADVYRVQLPDIKLISQVPSGTRAWFSGSGNDFGCPTQKGHGMLIRVPELAQHKSATALKLRFKSYYEMEWDYDYGFVLVSTNGGASWQSVASTKQTTISNFNPQQNACLTQWNNGITGVSGDPNTATNADRSTGTYPAPQWVDDEYDLSSLANNDELQIMFSYATDPGLAKRGWFIDDVQLVATEGGKDVVVYSSNFENDDESTRIFPSGTSGWAWISSDQGLGKDHAYYIELRDRVSWDKDGKGQADRGPVTWEPGVSMIYTNEAHGYGNFGVDDPPAQTPVDSSPQTGNATPNLDDAAFTAASGRNTFDGCTHLDNYSDPNGPNGLWKLPTNLKFVVSSLTGLSTSGTGPSSATATLTVDVDPDCNLKPNEPPVLSFGSDHSDPDPDGAYTLTWTRPTGAVGPDLLQETTTLSTLMSDDAESGLGKWTATTTGTGAFAWQTSGSKVHGGANAFWAHGADGATNAQSILTLNTAINVPQTGTTTLSFWDWYIGEGDDTITVEAKTGTDWEKVYETSRSALAPDAATAFANEAMSKHTFDLSSKFAGKSVLLRFVLNLGPEDRAGSSPQLGWYLDDIQVDTADWTDVVEIPGTSYLRGGRSQGTYYYRVRTQYPFGSAVKVPSPWSNVISTGVAANSNVDTDNDGVVDGQDNCPTTSNPLQEDADQDGAGDACDVCPQSALNDGDHDGVCDDKDNCVGLANPDQMDVDDDQKGDACDACPNDPQNDPDGDGVCQSVDNCPNVANADQADRDGNGAGDACDCNDGDGDGVCAKFDNCPSDSNPGQEDSDGDGKGDACDKDSATTASSADNTQVRGGGCSATGGELSLMTLALLGIGLRRRRTAP